MAKFGEGDPRWLVEHREDGQNVNGWHWEEKDLTKKAEKAFGVSFDNVEIYSDENGTATVTGFDSLTGDITGCRRKGKFIVIYDMELKAKWEFKARDDSVAQDCSGTLTVSEVELGEDNYIVTAKASKRKTAEDVRAVVDTLRRAAKPILSAIIDKTLEELKESAGGGGVPTPTAAASTPASTDAEMVDASAVEQASEPAAQQSTTTTTTTASSSSSSSSSKGKTFKQKITFHAPPEEMFEVLMDEGRVAMYTQAPARIGRNAGDAFEAFGGLISGETLEAVPGEKIVQKWRFNSWAEGTYSTLTIEFDDGPYGSVLNLTQTGIPTDEYDRTTEGWKAQYWARIKQVFGYDYRIH